MALRNNRPNKPKEYVLLADRESSQPTKFFLRPLSWEEETEAEEAAPTLTMSIEQMTAINEVMQRVKDDGRNSTQLTAAEIARINEIAPPDEHRINTLTRQHAIRCRYGIVEIQNMLDFENKPTTMSSAEFARCMPKEIILELGTEIKGITKLAEADIKK